MRELGTEIINVIKKILMEFYKALFKKKDVLRRDELYFCGVVL